ncbi:MAG: ATP-binding protein [Bacteroidota bacterium]
MNTAAIAKSSYPNLRRLAACICYCLLTNFVLAQSIYKSATPISEHFSVENGLPNNDIVDAVQDDDGLMWLATKQGVLRFNGFQFDPLTTLLGLGTASPYIVDQLLKDNTGNIWLLTYDKIFLEGANGWDVSEIAIFNPATTKVQDGSSYLNISIDSISYIAQDNDGVLYISTYEGNIYKLDKGKPALHKTFRSNSIYRTSSTHYTVCREGDCQIFDKKQQQPIDTLEDFLIIADQGFANDQLAIFGIPLPLKHGTVEGIPEKLYLLKENRLVQSNLLEELDMQYSYTTQLTKDQFGNLLLYDLNDTWVIDSTFNVVTKLEKMPIRLPDNFTIQKIVVDKQNNFWFCMDKGIVKLHYRPYLFDQYLQGKKVSTRSILPLQKNQFLINSYSGVRYVDTDKKTAGAVPFLQDLIGINMARGVDSHIVWQATHSFTIHKFNLQKKSIDRYPLYNKVNGMPRPRIYNTRAILRADKDQTIWAVDNQNIFYYDAEKDAFLHFFSIEGQVEKFGTRDIFDFGKLWITGNKGLFIIDKKSKKWEHLFPNIEIQFVHKDKVNPHIFWLGTCDRGLGIWNSQDKTLTFFDTEDGLSNTTIHGIFESKRNELWLSSNYGLMQFDKEKKSVNVFFKEDGLSDNEFNRWSHHQCEDGSLLLGGIDGIVHLQPDKFPPVSHTEKITILQSFITDGEQRSPLSIGQSIRIPSNSFNTELQLFLSDFINTRKVKFKYSISNSPSDPPNGWHSITDNSLIINQRPYGNYLLRIKARNGQGQWTKALEIPLVFLKPFYHQTWFYSFSAVALILLGFLFAQFRIFTIRRQKQKLEQTVLERTREIAIQTERLEKLNQTKDAFFTIIAHDLKSPIISLNNFSEKVKYLIQRNETARVEELCQHFNRRLNRLNSLLDNLLSWALEQKGDIPYRPQKILLKHTIQNNIDLFESTTEIKNVTICNQIDDDSYCFADINATNTILRNLISNAIKYSHPASKITIACAKENGYTQIDITDKGIGIEPTAFKKLFSDQKILNSSVGTIGEKGNGLGLMICGRLAKQNRGIIKVKSKVGKGSTFSVCLPSKEISKPES